MATCRLAVLVAAAQLASAAKLSEYQIVLASDASQEERYAASVIQRIFRTTRLKRR